MLRTSQLGSTEQTAYELNGGAFSTYGFQYKPGFGDAVRRYRMSLYDLPFSLPSAVPLLDQRW